MRLQMKIVFCFFRIISIIASCSQHRVCAIQFRCIVPIGLELLRLGIRAFICRCKIVLRTTKKSKVYKGNISPAFEWANLWKLLSILYGLGLALLLYFLDICLFRPKKKSLFLWIESKNKTTCERKSAMSSLNSSIIRVGSFKCKACVPL